MKRIIAKARGNRSLFAKAGLLFVTFVWGSTFVVVKDTLKFVDPFILVGYRFVLASVILGAILYAKRKNLFFRFKSGAILGIILWFLYGPQTLGLRYTSATNSVFITGLFIVFVPLFSFALFRRIPSKLKIAASLIALFGLWFLTGGLRNINYGDMLTLITAMAGALHILVADHFIKKNIDPYVLSFQQFLATGTISVAIGLIWNLSFRVDATPAIISILFLTLVPTLCCYVIQLVSQKFLSAVTVAIFLAAEPIFGALFAWTAGNEKFKLWQGFGGLLIVAGMLLSEAGSLFFRPVQKTG